MDEAAPVGWNHDKLPECMQKNGDKQKMLSLVPLALASTHLLRVHFLADGPPVNELVNDVLALRCPRFARKVPLPVANICLRVSTVRHQHNHDTADDLTSYPT
eukprot:1773214-Rhodomonas_salina.1